MSGAWRSLVARVLWELSVLQTRSIAITRLSKNITVYLVTISEDLENCWEYRDQSPILARISEQLVITYKYLQ